MEKKSLVILVVSILILTVIVGSLLVNDAVHRVLIKETAGSSGPAIQAQVIRVERPTAVEQVFNVVEEGGVE